MNSRSSFFVLALLAAACGPSGQNSAAPGSLPAPKTPGAIPSATRPDASYILLPALALQRNLMPLAATGVPGWLQAHPDWDGRGVLIAILDSGIDPTADGLKTTTTGSDKLVDLRDFSGEGRIALTRVMPQGDAVTIQGHTLTGFGRLQGLNAAGPWYAGVLREIPLGEAPASDVNWNNTVGDTLPILVTRATDGWVLLADLDGDGSLKNERPIHDYLVAHESFGWGPAGKPPSLGFAANFAEQGGEPILDLFFDNSAHGTHVAGIAAGHDLYGVAGFNGVAPGAEVLGLKIANDAQGGISTSGSMMAALDYAIRTAADRHRPLVINMSFGVGNEEEGSAVIDRLFDSVLAVHPDIVFAVSAGNDGPGRSTVGFPGSASRVISVGATFPRAFLVRDPGSARDPIAYFSSRGGELARPDIVTPGVAFSSAPRWNFGGGEVKGGTSMASPHAAGLAALLVSALAQSGRPIVAARVRQALMTTAQPLDGLTIIDQGAGLPNVGRAWSWLAGNYTWAPVIATAISPSGARTSAAFRDDGLTAGDTIQRFALDGVAATDLTARSDARWLHVAPRLHLFRPSGEITLTYDAAALKAPGAYVGTVTLWGSDTMAGPVARLVNTVVVPTPRGADLDAPPQPLAVGLERHWSFGAEASRPFRVVISSAKSEDVIRAFLYEPGGQPFRGGHEQEGSSGDSAPMYHVDARDVVAGNYEVVASAPPILASTAGVHLVQAPFTMIADLRNGTPILALRNLTNVALTAVTSGMVVGAAREETMSGAGADTGSLTLEVPAWVKRIEIDAQMPRDDWPRFTDFGVTLEDPTGAQIEKSPLNYAFGRLSTELPRQHGDESVTLKLYPGWAVAVPAQRWTLTVRVRYYGDEETGTSVAPTGSASVTIAPGGPEGVTFAAPASASLPTGFVPLIRWRATVGSTDPWTLEAPLANAPTPMMR